MPAENPSLDQFETQLAELEELVKALESGDTRLEDAVKHFERGMSLSRACEDLLKQAELRVQQLSRDNDGNEKLVAQSAPEPEEDA